MYSRSNNDIVFSYESLTLMKSFLESGINMLKISMTETGAPAIEEWSEHFPFIDGGGLVTDEMKRRLFSSPASVVEMRTRLISNGNNKYNISNDSISFSIIYDSECLDSDIHALDTAVYDSLVYGSLREWFVNSSLTDIAASAGSMYDSAVMKMSECVKKLECVILRQQSLSPIFDNMIK